MKAQHLPWLLAVGALSKSVSKHFTTQISLPLEMTRTSTLWFPLTSASLTAFLNEASSWMNTSPIEGDAYLDKALVNVLCQLITVLPQLKLLHAMFDSHFVAQLIEAVCGSWQLNRLDRSSPNGTHSELQKKKETSIWTPHHKQVREGGPSVMVKKAYTRGEEAKKISYLAHFLMVSWTIIVLCERGAVFVCVICVCVFLYVSLLIVERHQN